MIYDSSKFSNDTVCPWGKNAPSSVRIKMFAVHNQNVIDCDRSRCSAILTLYCEIVLANYNLQSCSCALVFEVKLSSQETETFLEPPKPLCCAG